MTSTREELLALAERVEALSGPDREVDCAIGVAIGRFRTEPNTRWPDQLDYIEIREGGDWYPGHGFDMLVPNWTASLDAALSLQPEGWGWVDLEISPKATEVLINNQSRQVCGRATTPALALTAVALRALAETAR